MLYNTNRYELILQICIAVLLNRRGPPQTARAPRRAAPNVGKETARKNRITARKPGHGAETGSRRGDRITARKLDHGAEWGGDGVVTAT